MITLSGLAQLAADYQAELATPVRPVQLGGRTFDTDAAPLVMGTVNLSRDSTYRESIAVSTESAVRKARVMAAQGAELVDIGAESSTAAAARVGVAAQVERLVPVISELAESGIAVSTETYQPEVAHAALQAGAQAINLTGVEHEEAIFDLAAEHEALVILCYVRGANVRELTEASDDPIATLREHFQARVARAQEHGVTRLVIDPGLGFYYANLTDPATRVRYQTRVLARTVALRDLGLPICHALPHAFDLFEEEFRSAEAFFAVLARLGGTGVFRTHEVPRVRRVLDALTMLDLA